jgi:hypothetical protein
VTGTEERFRFAVCPCPSMPVNYWRVAGEWVAGATLGPVDTEQAALADADRYNVSGADAWRIACPDCGQVFVVGVS